MYRSRHGYVYEGAIDDRQWRWWQNHRTQMCVIEPILNFENDLGHLFLNTCKYLYLKLKEKILRGLNRGRCINRKRSQKKCNECYDWVGKLKNYMPERILCTPFCML